MNLFKIFDVSGSAMSAQGLRMNVTASHLANADTASSSVSQTYRARHPVFSAVRDGEIAKLTDQEAALSVRVEGIVESKAPVRMEYSPNHPLANEEGYIYKPNVNTVEELTNMISASRSYQNNVEVLNTSKQLIVSTLKLGE
jgi:flagellar basal-body rod protein FlgC